jgi:hypothetical protein
MNCQQAKEQLLDLLYDELPADQRQATLDHLAQCDDCRAEMDKLRHARAALAQARLGEPPVRDAGILPACADGVPPSSVAGVSPASEALLPEQPRQQRQQQDADKMSATHAGETPAPHVAPRRPIRILVPLSAAAAILIAAAILSFVGPTTNTVSAATGPVEITRTGISLTILSAPQWADGWQGLALVRDQRLVKNLKQGVTEVRFDDVPTIIEPDTVRLRGLDHPDGLAILEQNYQYDLASAGAILKRYIDEPIAITMKNGDKVEGNLLSFDDDNLVIQTLRPAVVDEKTSPPGPQTTSRRQVQTITFAKLPDGLLAKPTLVWQLQNNADRQQQFEVAYMTAGLTWRADYVLKLHVARGALSVGRNGEETAKAKNEIATTGQSAIRNPQSAIAFPEITDTADLVGYATVTNNSGVTYEKAQLKLMAGDVNLIEHVRQVHRIEKLAEAEQKDDAALSFQEKSFFEYHLYTLGRPTTLRNAETKQIDLVSGSGVKLTRTYVYDPSINGTAAQVVSEVKNTEANGLGKPLPKGVIRLYAPGPDGEDTYVSQATIDHTPLNEKLRLGWGFAFDIACTSTTTDAKHSDTDHHISGEYSLRNHKDYDVTVTAIVRVPNTTRKFDCNRPWHIRDVGWIEIQVPLKANTEEKITFAYDYDTQSGGGLKEPKPRDSGSGFRDSGRNDESPIPTPESRMPATTDELASIVHERNKR